MWPPPAGQAVGDGPATLVQCLASFLSSRRTRPGSALGLGCNLSVFVSANYLY